MDVISVVDVVPQTHSDETNQDSEPSVAVNSENPNEIVVTAFTPPDTGQTNSPIYYSVDGGATWQLNFDVPFGLTSGPGLKTPGDQSVGFAAGSAELYGAFLRMDNGDLEVFRTSDPTASGTLPTFDERADIDQPWVEARKVVGGPDDGKIRLYVGYNNDGTGLGSASATVDVCLDAAAATPTFTQVLLEPRTVGTGLRDGYAVRPVAHADGTVYVAYERWTGGAFQHDITTDIVVARDDNWGAGATPFTSLVDGGDGLPGRIVATGVRIDDAGVLGQERLNNDLAIAVDPTNSDVVYLSWADNTAAEYTLRVRRSLNRGVDWSDDLLTVANATMAGLAINSRGHAGLMYQRLNGERWETHFRRPTNEAATTWDDLILSDTPANVPKRVFQPYLGDWARIVAVGKTYYGVFCANNTPDPANFPHGVSFQRNHTTSPPFSLLAADGIKTIPPSIDPFFFRVREVVPPTVTAVVPPSGPEAGGATVKVIGTGFTGTTDVRFGAAAATLLTVDSDTQLTVVSPPGAGTVDVTVTTDDGTSAVSPADEYTYIPPDTGTTGTTTVAPQAPAPVPPSRLPGVPVAPAAPAVPAPVATPRQTPPAIGKPGAPQVPPACVPPAAQPSAPPVIPTPAPVPGAAPCPHCGQCCCCAAVVATVANVSATAITAITAIAATAKGQ